MTLQQIGKVWTVIGLLLAYYALNSWIVSQGGKEVFEAKMVVNGKAPVALVAIIICATLLLVNSLIGRTFATRSERATWHERIPVVFLELITTGSPEGRAYQSFMLAALSVMPAVSLFHFWSIVLGSKIATTDDPPKSVGSIWDWSHFGLSDPARICTAYSATPKIVCGQNSTILPGLEPMLLAILTAAAILAWVRHLSAVFQSGEATAH